MPIAQANALKLWRVNVRRYDKIADLGWFRDQRVELLKGRIVKMAPQAEPHSVAILLAQQALHAPFSSGHHIRIQMPLHLGQYSKPEPDIAVIAGDVRDSLHRGTPTSAVLVVEISDATLRKDRGIKASLYAQFGIQDYWIVNLAERQLEIHRDPIADPTHRHQFRYKSVEIKGPADAVCPLTVPHFEIKVANLLP